MEHVQFMFTELAFYAKKVVHTACTWRRGVYLQGHWSRK